MHTTVEVARENARHDDGRFGAQEHTAPELTLGARAELDDLWEQHKDAAADFAQAQVALISARLHPTIAGIRFHVIDGKLEPSRILHTDASTPVTDATFIRDLDTLASYAQARNSALELSPVHDGTESWDWVPQSHARQADIAEAEDHSEGASAALQAAEHDLSVAAERYLTSQMPRNAHAVDIAYFGGTAAFNAYGANGEAIHIERNDPDFKDYQMLLSRVPATVQRISEARPSDILGTYFHLRKR